MSHSSVLISHMKEFVPFIKVTEFIGIKLPVIIPNFPLMPVGLVVMPPVVPDTGIVVSSLFFTLICFIKVI